MFTSRVNTALGILLIVMLFTIIPSTKDAYALDVLVQVTIEQVQTRHELGSFEGDSADFYFVGMIDGQGFTNRDRPDQNALENHDLITPNWQFSKRIDTSRVNIPITIQIFDQDGLLRLDDDFADINPLSGTTANSRNLELNVNLSPCIVFGVPGPNSNCATTLTSTGDEQSNADAASAEIRFRIDVITQVSTVKVTIEQIRTITERGSFEGIGGGAADFYAVVSIDGEELASTKDTIEQNALENRDDISPNWQLSKDVDTSRVNIPITIQIFDEDGGLRLDDDFADINPASSRRNLDLNINLPSCSAVSSAGDSITGTLAGNCATTLTSTGDEQSNADAASAEIRFRIDVIENPPTASNLLVECSHTPILPGPTDTVTITAKARTLPLPNSFTADSISIWVNSQSGPVSTQNNVDSLSFTAGPFAGSSFSYECGLSEGSNQQFSGWRRVSVGVPPASESRAIPVVFTAPRGNAIDIVISPDRNSYTGPTDSTFQSDVAMVISTFYSEDVFLKNQNRLNFWIARDMGLAVDGCGTQGPTMEVTNARGGVVRIGNLYPFADSIGILHRQNMPPSQNLRDCAPLGSNHFSADALRTDGPPPGSPPGTLGKPGRVFLHETGHRPFGLADEYCNTRPGTTIINCDGGYWQLDVFPNLFQSPADCINDEGTRLNQAMGRTCQEFTEAWVLQRDWSTSDSSVNDLMVDNLESQPLDERRINWVFEQCYSAQC